MTNSELISKVASAGFEDMPFFKMTNSEICSSEKEVTPGFEPTLTAYLHVNLPPYQVSYIYWQ